MEENEVKNEEKIEYKNLHRKVKDATEEIINNIIDEGIEKDNLELLDKLIDIHKDISEEEYWKRKEYFNMRYRNYGNYGNYGEYGNYSGSYGREQYGDGSYGRRGKDRRYRGEDSLYGMHDSYRAYSEGREEYNRGNYGAKEDTLKSLEYMLESMVDFVEMLKSEATSQEEMQLIRQYTQKIAQM